MFEDDDLNEDRGDNFTPVVSEAKEPEVKEPEEKEDDDQPRGPDGKFAKKDDGQPADQRIPKARFDEAVNKERERAEAAERRLAELEARLTKSEPAKPTVDPRTAEVDTLDSKIVELHSKRDGFLADGNAEKASELLREIRAEERKLMRLEAEMIAEEKAGRATSQASEESLVDGVVATLESTYEVLRNGSETYNERMVDLVVAEQQRLMATGLSPSKALLKAGTDIMELVGQKTTDETKGEDLKEVRRKEALAKNLDTAKRQPGALKDVGLDSNAAGAKSLNLEVDKMTDKEFGALTEEQLAKMRGDFV
jgi:hypothetical protein